MASRGPSASWTGSVCECCGRRSRARRVARSRAVTGRSGSSRPRPRRAAYPSRVVEQVLETRVAWVDTDTGGRIHFTAAFRWAEEAETELMRSLGLARERWGSFPRRKVE